MNAIRFNQIPSNSGLGLELKVIAAVAVGGAAITGGAATIVDAVLGVVLLGSISSALIFSESAPIGRRRFKALILVAIVFDTIPFHRRRYEHTTSIKLAPSGMQWILMIALLIEGVLFTALSPVFLTAANLLEILRYSVELGLLAIALTPILITGGIDFSVGSTVGLVAVIFGVSCQHLHLTIAASITIALLMGCACGAMNALLVAGLRLPPLIVTLGTYSLFRGIAEGITHAAESFTGYPRSFLWLGQGSL